MSEALPVQDKTLARNLTVTAMILVFFAQLTFGSRHLSLTADEPSHFINGYAILVTGDLWTVSGHVHPPLINLWSAWPLLLQPGRPDPRSVSSWGQDFAQFLNEMWPLLGPIERIEWVTRFPIMLLATVLMAIVYRWTADRFGHRGAVLALFVMAWDPAMVAHSQLSTTDLGVTLFTAACLFSLDRLRKSFSWRLAIGTGLLLGATLASKASGIILVHVVAVVLGWQYLQETGRLWHALLQGREDVSALFHAGGRWVTAGAAIAATGLLLLWGTYLFEWRALPGMPRAVPLASHISLFRSVQGDRALRSFLYGKRQEGGWWWYFPFVYAVKTPIPALAALCGSLALATRRGRGRQEGFTLWLFPTVYAGVAVLSGINIGYRHLLPILPTFYVSTGILGQWLFASPASCRLQIAGRWLAVALGAWYLLGTLNVYPYPLAYFNEFIGGPQNGYHYLADSNVDWGQSFKALRHYMEDQGIDWVWSSHYSWVEPGAYGIRYRPLPPDPEAGPVFSRPYDPKPGIYAISATTLQGLVVADPDTYEWFRHQDPIAQLGYGLLVYRVPARDTLPEWISQCIVPRAPLSAEVIREGFGPDQLRLIRFDCTQSWVYPRGGHSPGWYAAFRGTWQQRSDFLDSCLAPARLSYEQTLSGRVPPFVLFEWSDHRLPLNDPSTKVYAAFSGWPPARIENERPLLRLPVELEGPLDFVGYQLYEGTRDRGLFPLKRKREPDPNRAAELELWTWWQVKAHTGRPLSIMAHLVDTEGRPLAVADGLGVSPDQWQADDVLVQRHRFAFPADAPAGTYWLETGAYWLDTTTRWPIVTENASVGDGLLLSQIQIDK